MSQPIIKRARVQLRDAGGRPEEASVALVHGGACTPHGEKAVRLLEEAGRVRAIEFTCACGDVTCVELAYADENAPN